MTSLKQMEANRENGKKAKGKKTIWGKIKSSKNALKHGLLAEQFLIVGENKVEYEEFKQGLIDYYNPLDQLQEEIVFNSFLCNGGLEDQPEWKLVFMVGKHSIVLTMVMV